MAPGNIFKSIGAVVAGIMVIFFLSHVTDYILEHTGLMKLPFADNPLWVMLFVVIYRNAYIVAGSYITATLAPQKPMRHSIILACIGFVLGVLGAIAMWDVPPRWYPVVLIVLGWPSVWLGGWLKQRYATTEG
jgi:hypothetical protein